MKARYLGWFATALLAQGAAAQSDLAGTWQGTLQVDPTTALTIHFVISAREGGAYEVVLTSPDTGGIKDVPASGVTFTDGRLDMEVEALSGRYTGVLRDGVLEGVWAQEGQALPLTLQPYTAPVLSAEDIEVLRGEWNGKLAVAGLELTIVLRVNTDEAGQLVAMLDSPDQNARDIPVTDIVLEGGDLSFKVPRVRGDYVGQFTGEAITGQWSQGGSTPLPLALEKGAYVAPTHRLDLPSPAREQLAGSWRGTLGPLTVVLRFEADDQGGMLGFIDSPDQGANGIPVTEASFADGKLTLQVASIGATCSAALAGDTLEGEWTQLGMTNPVKFTRQ